MKQPPVANEKKSSIDVIPAKDYFVRMMTRDIALEDAILDLLDNCVDGILRSKNNLSGNTPYKGFYANISLDNGSFSISDNCGGISWGEREYAFKLGRDVDVLREDKGKPTVGAYGIGMKRALFKMGRHCYVTTRSKGEIPWEVEIKPGWFDSDDWHLPVKQAPDLLTHVGTEIVVDKLHEGVAELFDKNNSTFFTSLCNRVATQYAYILEKGFKVSVGKVEIKPRTTKLLFQSGSSAQRIAPFIYKGKINGVDIFMAVGFTQAPPNPEEAEDTDSDTNKRSSEDAGWTVLCNERAVVFNDKSFLTGWGETPIPQYHTQFIAVAGIVEFTSNNARDLPTTTTKHGVDASSQLYLHVKNYMRQGMKNFTQYTNRWKKDPVAIKKHFKNAGDPLSFEDIKKMTNQLKFSKAKRGVAEESYFEPPLPVPARQSSDKRITFYRPESQINTVGSYLFGGELRSPNEVGEACFESILQKAV